VHAYTYGPVRADDASAGRGARGGTRVAETVMLRFALLSLVATWIAALLRLARVRRTPAAVRYDARVVV